MGAEDFDKMQAYKIANGQVNANPLVDKDGMINLAMDYESEQESEGIVQKSIELLFMTKIILSKLKVYDHLLI